MPCPQGPGPLGPIPAGFTRLFNGQNLAGWRINDGALTATQNPPRSGGILLRDWNTLRSRIEGAPPKITVWLKRGRLP